MRIEDVIATNQRAFYSTKQKEQLRYIINRCYQFIVAQFFSYRFVKNFCALQSEDIEDMKEQQDSYQIMYIYKLAFVFRNNLKKAVTLLNEQHFELITLRLINRTGAQAKKYKLNTKQFSMDNNLDLDTLLLDAVFVRTVAELSEPGSELMQTMFGASEQIGGMVFKKLKGVLVN